MTDIKDIKLEALRNILDDINDQLSDLKGTALGVKQEIADLECPFKVGDRVTDGRYVWVITKLIYRDWKPYWALYGNKIKKDGNPGKQTLNVYSFGRKIGLVTDD